MIDANVGTEPTRVAGMTVKILKYSINWRPSSCTNGNI